MIELHLVGYTAELGHLVLDLVDGDAGRYRLTVDEDLFATLDELRERRRERGLPVGDLVEFADELGLTRDRLQRLQDDDARTDATAGRVSTGAAAAAWLLDAADEREAVDEPAVAEEADPPPPFTDTDEGDQTDEPQVGDAVPIVLPGWEDEVAHDHVAGDPVVFAPPARPPGPGPEPEPDPEAEPEPEAESEPAPESESESESEAGAVVAGPQTEDGVPAWGRPEPQPDDAAVRIVLGPPSRPAPDESEGLVARALASHGLTPAPAPADPAAGDPDPDPDPEPGPASETPTPDAADVPAARDVSAGDPDRTSEPPDGTPDPPSPIEVPAPVDGRMPPRPLGAPPVDPGRNGRPRETAPAADAPAPRPVPVLSPAEIQSRLRSGRSVRAVARAAGVDEDRIRRWEVPIVAERARILDQAHGLRLERPRLGRSSQPLGEAVRRNLSARGVARDDVAWETSRRRDGRWRVCVRYVSRGRKRSATWTYDPDEGELRAASDSARELGFVRRRRR